MTAQRTEGQSTDDQTTEALPRVDLFRPRGEVRPSRRGRWRVLALVLVHVVAFVHIAHWQVAGETMTPVEPSAARETVEFGYVNAGFVLFAISILATLILGRFFCGWACHIVALQDASQWLLKKVGIRPQPVRSRTLVWLPFLVAFMMFGWPVIERWIDGRPAPALDMDVEHSLTTDLWAIFPGFWVGLLTFVVAGFLLVYWLGAKGFCTYGCPYGAFFGVADRLAPGRIRVTDACEACGHCTATCTSGVRVHEEVARFGQVVDPGCMKCMDCVSVCPKDALYFGFGKPSLLVGKSAMGGAGRGAKGAARWDFTIGEELVIGGAGVAAFFAFWQLYSYVSMMLAAGLAALSAVALLLVIRLLGRAEVVFQGRQLKGAAGWTRGGRVAFAIAGLWVLGAAHSGYLQIQSARGRSVVESVEAEQAPGELDEATVAKLRAGISVLEGVRSLGWFTDPNVELALARAKRFVAPHEPDPKATMAEFRGHLGAVLDVEPGDQRAAFYLAANLVATERDLTEPRRVLEAYLEEEPGDREAQARLQHMDVYELVRQGQVPSARDAMVRLLEEYPDYALGHRYLARIEQVLRSRGR